MSLYPFSEFYSTFKDLTSKALRVVSESKITGGYSPANLTMQNAVTANGNGTLLNVNEYATAVLEVRGTFSATINFESSIDDTNWYPVLATKNDGTISSSCTTVGLYEIKVAAWKSIRARVSGYVSGNVTVVGKVSPLVNAEKSMQVTGSNVEQTLNQNLPAKANLMGISDGTKIQAMQGNISGVLLTSAARTISTVTPDQINLNFKGVTLFLDITAVTGSPSLLLYVQRKNPATGTYVSVLTSTIMSTTGLREFMVGPGITVTANQSVNMFLPRDWRVLVYPQTADSVTYSLSYAMHV